MGWMSEDNQIIGELFSCLKTQALGLYCNMPTILREQGFQVRIYAWSAYHG